MKMTKGECSDVKLSSRFAGEIAKKYRKPDTEDQTQDVCDGIYAALNLHRENCPACDGNGSGECVVGDLLHEAWGHSETFRDSFR